MSASAFTQAFRRAWAPAQKPLLVSRRGALLYSPYSTVPEFEIFSGGGGVSSGAGAGDTGPRSSHREDSSGIPEVGQPYPINLLEQLERPESSPNTALAEQYWEAFDKQWNVETYKSVSSPPLISQGKLQDELVEPPGQELDLGEGNQTPTTDIGSPSEDTDDNEKFRDWYIDNRGGKRYTRAPHTYYKRKHGRDICAIVEQRSHNGGKGASRAQQVAMIRAYYFCKNKARG